MNTEKIITQAAYNVMAMSHTFTAEEVKKATPFEKVLNGWVEEAKASNEEATEEVTTTEVSADTLDDVNVTNHKKGEKFDIEETKEYLNSLNFIEIKAFRKNVVNEKDQLEYYKNLADSLDIENMAKEIAIENFDEEYKGVKEVLKDYEPIMENLKEVIAAIDEKLEEFKDIPKTTTYMTAQLLEVYKKKMAALEKVLENPDVEQRNIKESVLNKYKTLIEVYSTRGNYSYLIGKSNVKHTINDLKKQFTRHKSGTKLIAKSRKVFLKYFTQEQMAAIEHYILDAFNQDKSALLVFMAHLAKILRFEQTSGLYTRVVILLMNILDNIASDIEYDIENGVEDLENFLRIAYKAYTMGR